LKDSYLTAGIKTAPLFRLLARNKLTLTEPKNIVRLAFLFQSSFWSSFFSVIEQVFYAKKLKKYKEPASPVFIIGHWRTGTTFLHQLMSLDPSLTAPTLFQVAVPDGFLVSYPYYRPLFKRVVSEHRPMDQVKLGMDEPQEDEYAIYRLTSYSPLENLVFPKNSSYFLNHDSPFVPDGKELEQWKKTVREFYRKISFSTGKRIVSKNPFHSFRIKILREMYPEAKFICLVRHPYRVVPSAINMWTIVQQQNSLNALGRPPGIEEVADIILKLNDMVEKDSAAMPPGSIVRVRFEDLEASPVETLKHIYGELGLPFSGELERQILHFLQRTASYKKNSFNLTPDQKSLIAEKLEFHMQTFSYEQDN
jgi:hypothetical protein